MHVSTSSHPGFPDQPLGKLFCRLQLKKILAATWSLSKAVLQAVDYPVGCKDLTIVVVYLTYLVF